MELSLKEYKNILSFYNVDFSNKTNKQIYSLAEDR